MYDIIHGVKSVNPIEFSKRFTLFFVDFILLLML